MGGGFSGEGVYDREIQFSYELQVTSKKSELNTQNSELKTQNWKLRFWWLWYRYPDRSPIHRSRQGQVRWYCGLRGLWLVITGTSTISVTKGNNCEW